MSRNTLSKLVIVASASFCVGVLGSCIESPVRSNISAPVPASVHGWQYQNPYPTSDAFRDVDFVDEMNGWALTIFGSIYHTKDGGVNWERQKSGLRSQPVSMQFVSKNVGWIIAPPGSYIGFTPCTSKRQSLHHTTDGGQTWEDIFVDVNNISSMQFISEDVGYIAGSWCNSGVILKTTDGGREWQVVSATNRAKVTSITFLDEDNGWAAANKVEYLVDEGVVIGIDSTSFVLKTEDGGHSWETTTLPGDPLSLRIIHFVDEGKGWLTSAKGYLQDGPFSPFGVKLHFTTEDGGGSWQRMEGGASSLNLSDLKEVHFFDENMGWGIRAGRRGEGQGLARTTDGGNTWKSVVVDTFSRRTVTHGMDFITSQNGWAVGSDGYMAHTKDAGLSWEKKSSASPTPKKYLKFFDELRGVGFSEFSSMYFSVDAGRTWTFKRISKDGLQTNDAHFQDVRSGWIFGASNLTDRVDAATILRTTDAGASWDIQFISDKLDSLSNSSQYSGLQSGMFIDDTHGWAVGSAGTLVRTTDGGLNWTPATISQDNLQAVSFVDSDIGWAVGENGTILSSADGGATWRTQESNTTSTLMDVDFATMDVGWIVGTEGLVLRTTNGGVAWESVSSGIVSAVTLEEVEFVNPLVGWTCGRWSVFGTTDGGITWDEQFMQFGRSFSTLSFINENTGWAGGSVLMHTTNGGR